MNIKKLKYPIIAVVSVLVVGLAVYFLASSGNGGSRGGSYYESRNVIPYGYEAGKWTMDYQAAVRYAQANNKNIFILFTGSDWDSLSLEMDEKVFQTSDWASYAAENFALVYLDFPEEDKGLSDEQKKLNNILAKKYGIKKFPGLIVLAKNEGQLGNFMPNTNLKAFLKRLDDIK